jgi:hypothetical protein
VRDFMVASDQNLGDIEIQLEQQSRALLRVAAEKAAQKKAAVVPPVCPVCQQRLSRVTDDHRRSFDCRFGTINDNAAFFPGRHSAKDASRRGQSLGSHRN